MTDTPTAAQFKARYPEFTAVPDALVDAVIAEAVVAVGVSWLERDRLPARMLLTAHTLSSEGEPGRSVAIAAGGNPADAGRKVQSKKVGDVQITYEASGAATSGGGDTDGGYGATAYGKRFLDLMSRNFRGPVVA